MQVVDAGEEPPAQAHDPIAGPHAGPCGGAARLDGDDLDRAVAEQVQVDDQPPRQRDLGGRDPQVQPADAAVRQEFADHPAGRVGRHGKTEPLGQGDDRRVDAHDAAVRIDQRPAGVAGVQGGRVLDDVLDQPPFLAAHCTAQGADHARGDGRLEAQGAADGDQQLPDAQGPGVAQLGVRQVPCGQAN